MLRPSSLQCGYDMKVVDQIDVPHCYLAVMMMKTLAGIEYERLFMSQF